MPAKTNTENIRVISWRGAIYTVEEVSELLGIPRPTLYRYLREYSIPHYRRSGKISIPEDSLERIREARDLHKEGLGTESVRRLLREGGSGGELGERLDSLSRTLEDLKERTASEEAVSSPTLRTLLARQSLLISAVFNLTEMVEEILLASGKPRKTVFGEVAGDLRAVTPLPEYARARQLQGPDRVLAVAESTGPAVTSGATVTSIERRAEAAVPVREGRFGHLGRRRRRGALAVLSIVALLLVGGLLAWQLPALLDKRAAQPPAAPGRESERASGAGGRGERAESGVREEKKQAGEVPDVSGRGVEEAARELSEAGYKISAIRTEGAAPEESSEVTGTDPPAGTASQPGAPVVIVMGKDENER